MNAHLKVPEPYRLADRALKFLNRKINLAFGQTKRALLLDGFDELQVLNGFSTLYDKLLRQCEEVMKDLCMERYTEMFRFLKGKAPDEDDVAALAVIYLDEILRKPDERTHYEFESEALRKRDRAAEAVNAVQGQREKDRQFELAMRYWSQQTGFYIDIVSDDMALKAMKDCGVTKVRWHIQNDNKVCDDCFVLDGEVFPINEVPTKHLRCRCWLEPVSG